MAYVVLMCPGCRSAIVADDDNETTSCNRCGDRMTIESMRFFHRSDSHDQAVHAAGAVNARQDGELDAYLDRVDDDDGGDEPMSPLDAAIRHARQVGGDDAVPAVLALAEREDLTVERVEELLERIDADPGKAEAILDRLASRGDLYMPTNGVYRRSAPSG